MLSPVVAHRWRGIGFELGLKQDELSKIEKRNHNNNKELLSAMMSEWLQMEEHTWEKLVNAVHSGNGGMNPTLARKIRVHATKIKSGLM